MRLLTAHIPADCDIYLAGDDHEGNRAQYEPGIDAMIADIGRNPRARLVHHGDAMETLTVDHPYYDPRALKVGPEGVPSIPEEQARSVAERYRPIAGQVVCWLMGNHEMRAARHIDLPGYVCRSLGISGAYGGYMARISYHDADTGALMFRHLAWHGKTMPLSRAGTEEQRRANQAAQLRRTMQDLAGDCILMSVGHTHRLFVAEPVRRLVIYAGGGEDGGLKHGHVSYGCHTAQYIEPAGRAYVNTGSFLRSQGEGWDTYAERAGLPPVELGYAVAHIRRGRISEIEERVV